MVFTSVMDGSTFGKSPKLQRFSSLEPRSPSSTLPSVDGYNIYTVPDDDDDVFREEKEEKEKHDMSPTVVPPPPTPGTAPSLDTKPVPWSQRKLRWRNVVLIAVGVILVIALAVGTALAIILVNNSDSSSKSSGLKPSSTPIPHAETQYTGHLTLSDPWQGTESDLSTLLTTDIQTLASSSDLKKAFKSSSFLSLSANKSVVYFSVDFDTAQLHQALESEDDQEAPLALAVQSLFRQQVVNQNTEVKLSMQPQSIVILDNIPVTSPPTDTTTSTSTSLPSSPSSPSSPSTVPPSPPSTEPSTEATTPLTTPSTPPPSTLPPSTPPPSTPSTTTTTTVSTTTTTPASTTTKFKARCGVMTFQPCHSVIGNSYFYLPNFQDHSSPEEAEAAFHTLLGPNGGADCSEHLVRFACSLLFPPCDVVTSEPPIPRPPCRSVCDAVKKCESFPNFQRDCDDLPTTNCVDLPPLPPTTTTTEEPTPKTTTDDGLYPPARCVHYSIPECQVLGYNTTSVPSIDWPHCGDNVTCLTEEFETFSRKSIQSGCTNDITFFCAYFFPECDREYNNEPIYACRETCDDAVAKCRNNLQWVPDCTFYASVQEYLCIAPHPNPPTTTTTTTPLPTDTCIDQGYSYCSDEGFTETYEKTWFANNLIEGVHAFEYWAQPTIDSGCYDLAKFFYCGVFFPKCDPDKDVGLPCRKYCEELGALCPNAVFPMDCTVLHDNDTCVHPKSEPTPQPTPSKPPQTTTLGPTECVPLEFSLCRDFGYHMTTLPNFYGDRTMKNASMSYHRYLEPSVSSGCSPNILFYACSVLFPSCEGPDAAVKLPCTEFCEETKKCNLLFVQNCTNLSDPNPETCLRPPERNECDPSTEFMCANINRCIPKAKVCDRDNDCGDWSDERDCECNEDFEEQCTMGLCIPSYKQCDGEFLCPDNSDEIGCENRCPKGQFKCEPGDSGTKHCIMKEWICDGTPDCEHGDDEWYCSECSYDQFTCLTTKACIPLYQACDGIPQCADHTDEQNNCINKVFGATEPFYLNLYYNEMDRDYISYDTLPVCAEGFTNAAGQTACMKMGEKALLRWQEVPVQNWHHLFFELDPNGAQYSVIGRGNKKQSCPGSGKLVKVDCTSRECGIRQENLPMAIINGHDALPGHWPWMVSFQQFGVHKCGGAIIHPYFILTAGHCVDAYMRLDSLSIVAGANNLRDHGASGREHMIRRIIIHPEFVYVMNAKDIALLELRSPLQYSDYIKPLCFPEESDVFTKANQCYIAGWGHRTGYGGAPSTTLQQTKLTLWDVEKCNSSFMWDGGIKEAEICAGYYNGLTAPCYGDSGSAIACKDEFGVWKSVGVASYVYKTCDLPRKPSVFASTLPYVDWIKNLTVCQFTCDNGICLFDKSMLCNAVDDCGDKSDEINLCDISANCTFTNYFLCGYYQSKQKWKLVTHGNTNRPFNKFPLFDHTEGGIPGKFLMGQTRGVDIYTPRIDLTKPHCMRFHYHMRGKVKQGMEVSGHDIDLQKWVKKWNVSRTIGPDSWLMGMFDLTPGNWDIVFRPHDSQVFSLDDMYLIEGTCADMKCLTGEFMCTTYGSKNCLPEAVRCNIVVNCDGAEDEVNCDAPAYICDFENGNLCALEQSITDSDQAEWLMTNSSLTPRSLVDHSIGDDTGTMLMIRTEWLLQEDKVLMFHSIYLGNGPHCLKFFYASTSPATLLIKMEMDNREKVLVRFTNRLSASWIPVQARIPDQGQESKVRLNYYVAGGDLGTETLEQAILIDDIIITQGECPTFSCPSDTLKCGGEAYCLPLIQVCDRVVDCLERTDEVNCECNENEFKCPTGSCIDKALLCDLTMDCPDGADEGRVCDSKRSISCDFEDKFLCGYSVNTSSNSYHWERMRGSTPTEMTGPRSDHTFMSDNNHAGYYIVADGQNQGGYTSLQSYPFFSTGKGLVFFYHAKHNLFKVLMTGRIFLMYTAWSTGEQRQLWVEGPSLDDSWKMQCVDLPEGNISISFVVQRGSGYSADIALDDVERLTQSCDMYLLSGRFGTNRNETPETSSNGEGGCKEDERPCRNKMCLKKELFCDGFEDCLDGHDEIGCDDNS